MRAKRSGYQQTVFQDRCAAPSMCGTSTRRQPSYSFAYGALADGRKAEDELAIRRLRQIIGARVHQQNFRRGSALDDGVVFESHQEMHPRRIAPNLRALSEMTRQRFHQNFTPATIQS